MEREHEMVQRPAPQNTVEERFTSLQPTYEDSVPPDAESWDEDCYDAG